MMLRDFADEIWGLDGVWNLEINLGVFVCVFCNCVHCSKILRSFPFSSSSTFVCRQSDSINQFCFCSSSMFCHVRLQLIHHINQSINQQYSFIHSFLRHVVIIIIEPAAICPLAKTHPFAHAWCPFSKTHPFAMGRGTFPESHPFHAIFTRRPIEWVIDVHWAAINNAGIEKALNWCLGISTQLRTELRQCMHGVPVAVAAGQRHQQQHQRAGKEQMSTR